MWRWWFGCLVALGWVAMAAADLGPFARQLFAGSRHGKTRREKKLKGLFVRTLHRAPAAASAGLQAVFGWVADSGPLGVNLQNVKLPTVELCGFDRTACSGCTIRTVRRRADRRAMLAHPGNYTAPRLNTSRTSELACREQELHTHESGGCTCGADTITPQDS